MIPYVTFIIPTKGRATLANTLISLYEQTMPDWKAIVIYDAVEPTVTETEKVKPIVTPSKLGQGVNSAGLVRNFGIDYALKDVRLTPGWFAFVDDDDILVPKYIENLIIAKDTPQVKPDIVAFSMSWPDGTILPKDTRKPIEQQENSIGISFACQHHVFDGLSLAKLPALRFEPSSGEDFNFLLRAKRNGYNIHISNFINYNVSPLGVAPDRRNK